MRGATRLAPQPTAGVSGARRDRPMQAEAIKADMTEATRLTRAGVHSGLVYGAAHDLPSAFAAMQAGGRHPAPGAPIPLIIFHGDTDPIVDPVNADCLIRQATGTQRRAAAARTRQETPGRRPYTRTVHRGPDGRTLAEQWTVHGTGHAWSGGTPHGSYTDPQGPDASTEMLRFFAEHPRRCS